MAGQTFFKSAINGFEKSGVLSYIDELCTKANQKEQELRKELDAVAASRDEMAQKAAEAEEKAVLFQQQLEEEKENVMQLTKTINDLNMEASKIKRAMEEKDREIQIQMERNRQLQFRSESLEYNSKKYDELSAEIGQAMIEAKHTASQMLTQAQDQAKDITRAANNTVTAINTEIVNFKDDVDRLKSAMGEAMQAIAQRLFTIEETIAQAEDSLHNSDVLSSAFEDGQVQPEEGNGESEADSQDPSEESLNQPVITLV